MDKSLFILIGLQAKGGVRRMLRGARGVRGAMFLVIGVVVFALWLGPSLWTATHAPRTNPDAVRNSTPFILLAFCVSVLLTSAGEKAVAFTPAEVDFLFPGPFTRRQLLGYKMLKRAFAGAFSSAIFSIILLRHASYWLACYVGVFLALMFVQMFSMAVVLVGQMMENRAYQRIRKTLGLAAIAVVVAAIAPSMLKGFGGGAAELMQRVRSDSLGAALLAPLDVFGQAMTASTLYPGLLSWAAMGLGIDLALFAIVVFLDANYLEVSLASSRKLQDRMQRIRRGGGIVALNAGSHMRWRVKMLPWLGGMGPIAWRQMTYALRNSRGVMILLSLVIVAAVGPMLFSSHISQNEVAPGVVGVAMWLTIFLAAMFKFDFRDEVDRMDYLKSLPLSPLAIAAGELIAPVTAMLMVQLLLLGGGVALAPRQAWLMGMVALFLVPFDVLMFGIENLLFLLFPSRPPVGVGDMQLFGRQALSFVGKVVILLGALAVAGGIALAVHAIGGSKAEALAVAWILLSAQAAFILPCMAWAFRRVDPGSFAQS